MEMKYYFAAVPNPDFKYTTLVLVIGLLFIATGIGFSYFRKKHMKDVILKKITRSHSSILNTYGLLILILLLIREAGIPYLSMRFWWVLLLLSFFYILLRKAISFNKDYNSRLSSRITHATKNKYLPKKKK